MDGRPPLGGGRGSFGGGRGRGAGGGSFSAPRPGPYGGGWGRPQQSQWAEEPSKLPDKWTHDLFQEDRHGVGRYKPQLAPATTVIASSTTIAAPLPPDDLFNRMKLPVPPHIHERDQAQREDAARRRRAAELAAIEEEKRTEDRRKVALAAEEKRRIAAEQKAQQKALEDQSQQRAELETLWKLYDIEQEGLGRTSISVHGLQHGTTEEDVKTAFGPYGRVLFCMIQDPRPQILTARIVFTTRRDAQDAVDKLNGAIADGNPLLVEVVPKIARPPVPDFTAARPSLSINRAADLVPQSLPRTMRADIIQELTPEKTIEVKQDFDEVAMDTAMDTDDADAAPASAGRNGDGRGRGGGGRGGPRRSGPSKPAGGREETGLPKASLSLVARLDGGGGSGGESPGNQRRDQPARIGSRDFVGGQQGGSGGRREPRSGTGTPRSGGGGGGDLLSRMNRG